MPEKSLCTMIAGAWLVFASLFIAIYIYFKDIYRYWQVHGVPFLELSFPFGNFRYGMTAMSSGEVMKSLYEKAKGKDFFGFWLIHRPVLMIRNPELIKRILVKDFSHFCDRAVHVDEKLDPLYGHLFALKGEKWKHLRYVCDHSSNFGRDRIRRDFQDQMTPTFTTGKMKMMFPIVSELSRQMISYLEKVETEVEIGEIHARFTTDVISACAFGIRSNSITNSESDFRKMGRKIFEPSFTSSLRTIVLFMLPKLARTLKLRIIPKEVSNFFLAAVKETIFYRESSGISGKDFIQLLIQLKNNGTVAEAEENSGREADGCISLEQAAAQAFVFFMAGFETSSTTMTYAMYELSRDENLQRKVREEIQEVIHKHGGEPTHESIQEMNLLDKVILETLRKYPPISALNRECTKNYQIPGTDVVIERGTLVITSILGLHRDHKYYPNPERFDPERFTEEAKLDRHRFTYLPFGEGPRVCIGLRFGLMQTKIGLAMLLINFRFRLSPKTTSPLRVDPNSIVMTPKGGVWIELEPRR